MKRALKYIIGFIVFLINIWLLLYIGHGFIQGEFLISGILFIIYVGNLIWMNHLLELEIFYSKPITWKSKLTDKEKLLKLKKESSKYVFPEDLE